MKKSKRSAEKTKKAEKESPELPDYRLVLDQHNRAFRKIGNHYHLVAHICFAKRYDDWIASGGEDV